MTLTFHVAENLHFLDLELAAPLHPHDGDEPALHAVRLAEDDGLADAIRRRPPAASLSIRPQSSLLCLQARIGLSDRDVDVGHRPGVPDDLDGRNFHRRA